MIETAISISVNRKSDIELIKDILVGESIDTPIIIVEYEDNFLISLSSDYEHWELDLAILNLFPAYQFVTQGNNGRKEIRLEITRYQSEFSTTDWGSPIENPLNETKYLVKASPSRPVRFSPLIEVLFGKDTRSYYVNIVAGKNTATGEQGFLLLDNFSEKNQNGNPPILKDKLYSSPQDAFHRGIDKIEDIAKEDFLNYFEVKKKGRREFEKIPRKIIRNFIKGCNSKDHGLIFKNVSKNIVFEISSNWKTETVINNIQDFRNYFESPDEEICQKEFKIRTKWYFDNSDVAINLACYTAKSTDRPKTTINFSRMAFTLNDVNEISKIKWIK